MSKISSPSYLSLLRVMRSILEIYVTENAKYRYFSFKTNRKGKYEAKLTLTAWFLFSLKNGQKNHPKL